VYEPQVRGAKMNDQQRSQFVQKAKLDRIAYEAAQLLSLGEISKATTLVDEGSTSAGKEQLKLWLRHYATTRFKIAGSTVDAFLGELPVTDVAL
jgi:hypothetical protein